MDTNKCDRCCGKDYLFHHREIVRCPSCIWRERQDLIQQGQYLLNTLTAELRHTESLDIMLAVQGLTMAIRNAE